MILVPAIDGHAYAIAPVLRCADLAEIHALARDETHAIILSIRNSPIAMTWLVNGAPACIFGVAATSLLDRTGRPWLVSSDDVPNYPTKFLRACKRILPELLAMFPHLENYVDGRYALAIRWLQWLGFTIHPAEPLGPHGVPFHRFEMGKVWASTP